MMQIALSPAERAFLVNALAAMRSADESKSNLAEALAARLRSLAPAQITVGVYGGQVQWVTGNPFPIRVCDYDGEEGDLPDVDERGQRCRMWQEPADRQASGT